jgi:uncharacterized protein
VTNLQKFSLETPIIIGLILLSIALCFRLLDIFLIRSDERFGEIFFSKALGFILVLFFVWGTGKGLKSIGLHSNMIFQSIFIGAFVTTLALGSGYLIEYLVGLLRGVHPKIYFGAIDPKANVSGGVLFGLWLVMGNIINSFMEEGLFRGILIRLFGYKLILNQANWLQSFLFGIWHIPWTFKEYQLGKLRSAGNVAFSGISNFVPQLFIGFVWGYMYIKTNSLWASWISHTLTNSTLNLLHIKTDEGIDSGLAIRMVTYVVVMLLGIGLIKYLANWFGFQENNS